MTSPVGTPPNSPREGMNFTHQNTLPGEKIENLNLFVGCAPSTDQKTWSEWASDRAQLGLGHAIEQLIAGVFIGLGQIFIQKAGEMIVGTASPSSNKAPISEKDGKEVQSLKIAAITGDCESLLETNGRVKEAVLNLLHKAQNEESNNYPAYLMGVSQCKAEWKKNHMPPVPAQNEKKG